VGYRGWHGVTDKSNNLLAISYEPISGVLACRFKSRVEPYLYDGVPENIYQIRLRSPYAGSYFRKHVRDKYKLIGEDLPEPYQPTELPNKIPPATVEIPVPAKMQMALFADIRGSRPKRPKRASTHS
jgi:hypothetical protein